eukprot:32291-Eustigmatos_ZCMA.PRE.1
MNLVGLGDQMVDKTLRYKDQVGKLKLSSIAVEDVLGSGAPRRNLFDRYMPSLSAPTDERKTVTDENGIIYRNFAGNPTAPVSFSPEALGMWEAWKAGYGPYTAVMP